MDTKGKHNPVMRSQLSKAKLSPLSGNHSELKIINGSGNSPARAVSKLSVDLRDVNENYAKRAEEPNTALYLPDHLQSVTMTQNSF